MLRFPFCCWDEHGDQKQLRKGQVLFQAVLPGDKSITEGTSTDAQAGAMEGHRLLDDSLDHVSYRPGCLLRDGTTHSGLGPPP